MRAFSPLLFLLLTTSPLLALQAVLGQLRHTTLHIAVQHTFLFCYSEGLLGVELRWENILIGAGGWFNGPLATTIAEGHLYVHCIPKTVLVEYAIAARDNVFRCQLMSALCLVYTTNGIHDILSCFPFCSQNLFFPPCLLLLCPFLCVIYFFPILFGPFHQLKCKSESMYMSLHKRDKLFFPCQIIPYFLSFLQAHMKSPEILWDILWPPCFVLSVGCCCVGGGGEGGRGVVGELETFLWAAPAVGWDGGWRWCRAGGNEDGGILTPDSHSDTDTHTYCTHTHIHTYTLTPTNTLHLPPPPFGNSPESWLG